MHRKMVHTVFLCIVIRAGHGFQSLLSTFILIGCDPLEAGSECICSKISDMPDSSSQSDLHWSSKMMFTHLRVRVRPVKPHFKPPNLQPSLDTRRRQNLTEHPQVCPQR